jgi:hypothetical protein
MRETRETWAKRVAEWRESKLTCLQFAEKRSVSPHALRWWAWKLGSTTRAKANLAKAPAVSAVEATPLTFIEMTATPAIEVVLRNGIVLRVAAHFDDKALDRLIGILERR